MSSILGGVGSLVGGLLGGSGGSTPQVQYTPPGFNAGGLNATFSGNNYSVSPSADRLSAVGGLASTFGQQAGELGALRSTVTPGFSALRQAQLTALNNNRTQAMGNLRENLAQRRVLGSSFAQNSLANADRQYQQDTANVMAQTYLQELSASTQLIQQQYTAARGQFETGLNEMNLEANLAANLTGKASSALESAAATNAELQARAQAGAGQFFGMAGGQIGSGLGQLFGGSGGFSLGSLFGGGGAAGGAGALETLPLMFA